MTQKDLFGQALYDYWHNNQPEDMITWTNLTDKEILPTLYLFRSFDEMPLSEQLALQAAQGRILDVGAGSGTHSLWLQEHQKDVTALELSDINCKLMQERGLKKVVQQDFFNYNPDQKFDTLLLLMNGVGIVQKAQHLDKLFEQINNLMSDKGQTFLHSSDLKYLYDTGKGYQIPKGSYYGDLEFFVSYKGQTEDFLWTYVDENTLRIYSKQHRLNVEKIDKTDEADFLLRLTKI
jgi:SAM-dependent methyltransferase